MKVILASKSPRRKELLQKIFTEFDVIESDFDEKDVPKNIKVHHLPEYLAIGKAKSIKSDDKTMIISADTIVCLNNKILHKPKTEQEAYDTLKTLSNKKHKVITGVCVIYQEKVYSFTCKTIVKFYKLDEQTINKYILTKSPFDKAGGYGIQDSGALFVKYIKGDYYNVMGLPLASLNQLIKQIL